MFPFKVDLEKGWKMKMTGLILLQVYSSPKRLIPWPPWVGSLKSGPEVIKLFSCSTQLSIKFFLLINVKMPTTFPLTVVGILTFMSGKNIILGLSEPIKSRNSWYFYTYEHLKFHAQRQLSWVWKKFYDLGAWSLHILHIIILLDAAKLVTEVFIKPQISCQIQPRNKTPNSVPHLLCHAKRKNHYNHLFFMFLRVQLILGSM